MHRKVLEMLEAHAQRRVATLEADKLEASGDVGTCEQREAQPERSTEWRLMDAIVNAIDASGLSMSQLMDGFDVNSDAGLTIRELANGLQKLGLRLSHHDAAIVFARLDSDKNGKVDFDELYKACKLHRHKTASASASASASAKRSPTASAMSASPHIPPKATLPQAATGPSAAPAARLAMPMDSRPSIEAQHASMAVPSQSTSALPSARKLRGNRVLRAKGQSPIAAISVLRYKMRFRSLPFAAALCHV